MAIGEKLFRIGQKQVFLPSKTICMLRPKSNAPPNLAYFKVPLDFNKLDMRDYLLHAYDVETTAVRSQVFNSPISKHKITGKTYRPIAKKYMTVELVKPFVWPAPILKGSEESRPWMQPMGIRRYIQRMNKAQEIRDHQQKTGFMPLRDQLERTETERNMTREMERLLKQGGWKNNRELDPRFKAAEKKEKEVEEAEEEELEEKK